MVGRGGRVHARSLRQDVQSLGQALSLSQLTPSGREGSAVVEGGRGAFCKVLTKLQVSLSQRRLGTVAPGDEDHAACFAIRYQWQASQTGTLRSEAGRSVGTEPELRGAGGGDEQTLAQLERPRNDAIVAI